MSSRASRFTAVAGLAALGTWLAAAGWLGWLEAAARPLTRPAPTPAPRAQVVTSTAFASQQLGWVTVWDALEDTLLATEDGGRTWRRILSWPDTGPFRIGFFDGRHGVVLQGQTVAGTADGGHSWSFGTLPRALEGGPQFTSATEGWAMTDPDRDTTQLPRLVHTADGGRTWAEIPQAGGGTGVPGGRRASPAFTGPRTGFLVRDGCPGAPCLSRTDDGGGSWTHSPLPLPAGIVGAPALVLSLSPPAFAADGTGVLLLTVDADAWARSAASPAGTGRYAYVTRDGKRWSGPARLPPDGPAPPHRLDLQPAAGGYLWAVAGPELWTSADAGATWWHGRLALPPGHGPRQLAPLDGRTAWLVTANGGLPRQDGRLFRTGDGGRTWTECPVSEVR